MRRKKSRRGAAALIVALCLVVVVAAAAVLLLWDGGRLLGLNRPGGSGAMDSEQAASRSALEAERDALRQQSPGFTMIALSPGMATSHRPSWQ